MMDQDSRVQDLEALERSRDETVTLHNINSGASVRTVTCHDLVFGRAFDKAQALPAKILVLAHGSVLTLALFTVTSKNPIQLTDRQVWPENALKAEKNICYRDLLFWELSQLYESVYESVYSTTSLQRVSA